jgi:hypothetical protein
LFCSMVAGIPHIRPCRTEAQFHDCELRRRQPPRVHYLKTTKGQE